MISALMWFLLGTVAGFLGLGYFEIETTLRYPCLCGRKHLAIVRCRPLPSAFGAEPKPEDVDVYTEKEPGDSEEEQ